MALKPDPALQDFVVRFTHPTLRMRTMLLRAQDFNGAVKLALDKLNESHMAEWALLDLVSVADSILRREGKR